MKDDGRIPRIKDTDMTDRLLTAGAIAEDTRNPIGDIAACFPGHGSQSVGMFHARAGCVCSIESGPCERVDVFHVSGRFWSTSACGEKRTPARPAWTSFPS